MEKLRYELQAHYHGRAGLDKVEKDERGGVKHAAGLIDEWVHVGNKFNSTPNWTNVEATLAPVYKNQELRNEPTMSMRFYVEFWGTTTDSVIYFDDFKLVEE